MIDCLLFNIFINGLNEEEQGYLSGVQVTWNWVGTHILEDRNQFQNDEDRFVKWAENNRMKFNKVIC